MEEILKSLYDKYHSCLAVLKENEPSRCVDGKLYHLNTCKEKSHRECWAKGTRARILLEATSRFIFMVTGEQSVWCGIKSRPKLNAVVYYIIQNSEDISNKNYQFLMDVKNKLVELGYGDKKKKEK